MGSRVKYACTEINNPAYENGGEVTDNDGYHRLDPATTTHFREPSNHVTPLPPPHKVTFTRVTCTFKRIVTFVVAIIAVLVIAVAIYFIVKAASDQEHVLTSYSCRSVTSRFRVLNIDYNDSYNVPESAIYRDLAYNLSTLLTAVLANTTLGQYHNRTLITSFQRGSVIVNFVYVFNKLFNGTYLEEKVDQLFRIKARPTSDWNVTLDHFLIESSSIEFKAVPIEGETGTYFKTTLRAAVTTQTTWRTNDSTAGTKATAGTTAPASTSASGTTDSSVKTSNNDPTITTTTTTPSDDTTTRPLTEHVDTTTLIADTTTSPPSTYSTTSATYSSTSMPPTTSVTKITETTTTTIHTPEEFILRLVGGLGDFEGRVEVKHQGHWTSICDTGWNDTDAQVVCRQLNYTGIARARLGAYFGGTSGAIWLNNVNCRGDERQLALCPATTDDAASCGKTKEAGVTCDVDNIVADVLSIRLVGGELPSEGRVEVSYNATWGTVCGEQLTSAHATVVCRMLNYTGRARAVSPDRYNLSADMPWLTLLECSGNETTLALCEHAAWGQQGCLRFQYLAVQCNYSDAEMTATSIRRTTTPSGNLLYVRLEDGPTDSSGRVEVNNGTGWGTICRDLFDDNAAKVLCRMLGKSVVGSRYELTRYGAGTGMIWLNHVVCNGTESSILDCLRDDWGNQSTCTHMDDVSISCDHTSTQSPDLTDASSSISAASSGATTGKHTVHLVNSDGTAPPTASTIPEMSSSVGDRLSTSANSSGGDVSIQEVTSSVLTSSVMHGLGGWSASSDAETASPAITTGDESYTTRTAPVSTVETTFEMLTPPRVTNRESSLAVTDTFPTTSSNESSLLSTTMSPSMSLTKSSDEVSIPLSSSKAPFSTPLTSPKTWTTGVNGPTLSLDASTSSFETLSSTRKSNLELSSSPMVSSEIPVSSTETLSSNVAASSRAQLKSVAIPDTSVSNPVTIFEPAASSPDTTYTPESTSETEPLTSVTRLETPSSLQVSNDSTLFSTQVPTTKTTSPVSSQDKRSSTQLTYSTLSPVSTQSNSQTSFETSSSLRMSNSQIPVSHSISGSTVSIEHPETSTIFPESNSETSTLFPESNSETSTIFPASNSETSTLLAASNSETASSVPTYGPSASTSFPESSSRKPPFTLVSGSLTSYVTPIYNSETLSSKSASRPHTPYSTPWTNSGTLSSLSEGDVVTEQVTPTSHVRLVNVTGNNMFTGAPSAVCEAINVTTACVSRMPYHSTVMPNNNGHNNQSEVKTLFEDNHLDEIINGCPLDTMHFLCSYYLPKCDERSDGSITALRSCRSLCERARAGCEPFLQAWDQAWMDEWECSLLPMDTPLNGSCFDPAMSGNENNDSSSNLAECEAITLPMCLHDDVTWNETRMPNVLGHVSQLHEALQYSQAWTMHLSFSCHSDLRVLLCSVYVPRCTTDVGTPLGPCRSECERVQQTCGMLLQWPAEFNCTKFPDKQNGEACLLIEGRILTVANVSNYTVHTTTRQPDMPVTDLSTFTDTIISDGPSSSDTTTSSDEPNSDITTSSDEPNGN